MLIKKQIKYLYEVIKKNNLTKNYKNLGEQIKNKLG
jgi:hypothetical protein